MGIDGVNAYSICGSKGTVADLYATQCHMEQITGEKDQTIPFYAKNMEEAQIFAGENFQGCRAVPHKTNFQENTGKLGQHLSGMFNRTEALQLYKADCSDS
jgi:hypothetical protein